MRLPKRHGVLFDPDRFPFLEGRTGGGARQIHERIEPPLVPDGTIYRALEKLLVLDGERISYRALDVEQIGSVYETMMGFRLETATGRSVAIKAQKKHGRAHGGRPRGAARRAPRASARSGSRTAPTASSPTRSRRRSSRGRDARGPARGAPAGDRPRRHARPRAAGRDGAPAERGAPPLGLALHAARAHRADRAHDARADPRAPARRRRRPPPRPSRSSTSRSATRRWARARSWSRPAASSATRWSRPGTPTAECPTIPPDEDEVIFARRLVAQRCLYGVDRNPVAVDLAKMSLWLVTLARTTRSPSSTTRCATATRSSGSRATQIEAFHWDAKRAAVRARSR